MTQIILNIPDKEVDFFMTLVKKFNYQLVNDNTTDFVLSAKQLALLDRRSKTPVEECITANNSIKQLKKKYGL